MYWTTPSGTRYHTGSPRPVRARQSVELMARAGISTRVTRSRGIDSRVVRSMEYPGRVQPTKCASANSSTDERQPRMSASASAPVMKNRSASGWSAARSVRVSIVYVGPPRSRSTRDTVKRGFEAVATTVIRYRCSAGLTERPALWYGCPVGTKRTSSSPNHACTSLAATRWPWWIGSKVPPITPSRRRSPSRARASGCGSGVVATAADRQDHQQGGQQDAQCGAPDGPGVHSTEGTGGLRLRFGEEDHQVQHERHAGHPSRSGRAGTGTPSRPSRTSETTLSALSASATASPRGTEPVASSSTANSEEFAALPRRDQFHNHSGRSTA